MPAEGLLEFGGPLVYHAHFMTFTLYLICKHPFYHQDGTLVPYLSENGTMNCHDSALVDGTCDTRGSLNGWTLLMPPLGFALGPWAASRPCSCVDHTRFSVTTSLEQEMPKHLSSVWLSLSTRGWLESSWGKTMRKREDRGVEKKKGGPDGPPGPLSWWLYQGSG